MKNKKAGMSIPIVVLTILTLVLVVLTLFYFSTRDKENKKTLMVPSVIDELYIEEARLNYHIQIIFENAVENIEEGGGKESFIQIFKEELASYKDKTGKYLINGMEQVEEQMNNQDFINKNLIIDNKKVELKLKMKLFKSRTDNNQDMTINYEFEKSFEKVFKG